MKDDQPEQQDKNIKKPLENDIILGRGGASIHNDANVRYRTMVREHKKAYQTFTRLQKTQLAESLVEQWQNQTPRGRFLELDAKTNTYYCISDKSARRKTSQLLREGAPKIRRQLKEEAIAASPTPMTPPPSSLRRLAAAEGMRTPSPPVTTPLELAPKIASPPPPQRRGPPSIRTPASKLAKAKLKAAKRKKTLFDAPAAVLAPRPSPAAVLATPPRPNNYAAPTTATRPPLMPHPSHAGPPPRMATPPPQAFTSPLPPPRCSGSRHNSENWPMPGQHHQQRWQQWNTPYNYHQYRHPYYAPRTTSGGGPPPPPATPLKTITPADANQRNINTYTPAPPPPASTKPVPVTDIKPHTNTTTTVVNPAPPPPVTPKPAAMEREFSISKPPRIAMKERKISSSPESVLDFVELCSGVPINSWDVTSDDEMGLMMTEAEEEDEAAAAAAQEEDEVAPATTTTTTTSHHPGQQWSHPGQQPKATAEVAIIDDAALHMPQLLSPPRRRGSCCSSSSSSGSDVEDGGADLETIINKPASSSSPPRLEFRRDCHPIFLDTLQCSSSFDSFDRMESLFEQTAEDFGASSIDILNELDKDMESSDFLRPCHSF